MLFETGIEILFPPSPSQQFPGTSWVFGMVEDYISINDTHVMNTVHTLRPEVSN